MMTINSKAIIQDLKMAGYKAEYQEIKDEDDKVIDDEIAIYDKFNKIQLFYVCDNEFTPLQDKHHLSEDQIIHIKSIVFSYVPNIAFNI